MEGTGGKGAQGRESTFGERVPYAVQGRHHHHQLHFDLITEQFPGRLFKGCVPVTYRGRCSGNSRQVAGSIFLKNVEVRVEQEKGAGKIHSVGRSFSHCVVRCCRNLSREYCTFESVGDTSTSQNCQRAVSIKESVTQAFFFLSSDTLTALSTQQGEKTSVKTRSNRNAVRGSIQLRPSWNQSRQDFQP